MRNRKKFLKKILIIICAVFVLFSSVSFIIVKLTFDNIFRRTEFPKYSTYLCYEDVKEEHERELLTFTSGENKLQGYLYGTNNTKGLVVISHGLGGGAENYLPETIYFVEHGYQVFTFDNTGCYESEGQNCIGLLQSVIDLDAALTFIESEVRFEDLPIFLYGHSWGGYAVTAIYNYDHDIAASVSVAGFNDPMTIIMEWGKDMMGPFIYAEYPYIYLYVSAIFGNKINMTAVDGINNTDTPILIIHGSEDDSISIDNAATIAYKDEITNPNVLYKVCDKDKQNDHQHLFTDIEAIEYMDEQNKIYMELYMQYDGKIPEEELAKFYAQLDKEKVNIMDEDFMQDVLDFYENSIN